jgi:hypothetical protein
MSIYVKKDNMDREKVSKKFDELKKIDPVTAETNILLLLTDKTWSELEYKELVIRYRLHRIVMERRRNKK